MAFNAQEYEQLQKKLSEMKKDEENFKKYQEEKAAERNKFEKDADTLYTELKKRKHSDADIAAIAGKLRWRAMKAQQPQE